MASRTDATDPDAASSQDDEIAVVQGVGDLAIDTGKNVAATVTAGAGAVAVTLAIQTPAGKVSVSLSASDAERLAGSLATAAAELDEEAADRGAEWIDQYRSEDLTAEMESTPAPSENH